MIILHKTREASFKIPLAALLLLLCSIAGFSFVYAETENGAAPVTESIQTDPEVIDLKYAKAPLKTPDDKQLAYINFILSTINISNGDYITAIENLKR
jgi:hypothetical protein